MVPSDLMTFEGGSSGMSWRNGVPWTSACPERAGGGTQAEEEVNVPRKAPRRGSSPCRGPLALVSTARLVTRGCLVTPPAAVVGSWPGHGAAALRRWHVADTLQPGMLGLPSLVLLVTAGAS